MYLKLKGVDLSFMEHNYMNWYGLIKIALPILQRGYSYSDIGHTWGQNPNVKEWLWLIDKDWNLLVKEVPELDPRDAEGILDSPTHEAVWPEQAKEPATIAIGRIEENKRTGKRRTSLLIVHHRAIGGYIFKEKMIEKVSRLLDRAFKNPEISTY